MVVWSAASPASAEEWTRKTVHGGELSRSVDRDGNIYTGSTTRTGPNGKTFSGERYSAAGPFRGRSVGSFTGPNGNTVHGFRRWRR
jgi:hypothetical protein